MRPKAVTQNRAFIICEVVSIHILRDEYKSLQVGWHIAGEALTRRRKSMPPQAIILRRYIVMKKPYINPSG